MKKSGGSCKKAADASGEKNYIDVLFESGLHASGLDNLEQKLADKALACGHCEKPQGTQKFLKCSTCLLVSYCSKECQKAHWKKSHKSECKPAPPRHPCFIDSNKSVDARSRSGD